MRKRYRQLEGSLRAFGSFGVSGVYTWGFRGVFRVTTGFSFLAFVLWGVVVSRPTAPASALKGRFKNPEVWQRSFMPGL